MTDILIIVFSSLGALFILIAAVGLLKMPDFYLRVSVTTKAVTLGVGLILSAAAVSFSSFNVTTRVIAIIIFIILTAPVAAHMIGRAAYFIGIKMWDKSVMDDLEGKYHRNSHTLGSNATDEEDNLL
ncbi:MAG: monovalent cation/H(+) antiporter subunit G [Schleiferiaceae bacterium]|nr:monovalent cation/H(+) antiporter subunit G [Schleiferiaceae bacterium]